MHKTKTDIPFTVDGWEVDGFSVEITLDLPEPATPVELRFGWSEFGGWDVYRSQDADGRTVDVHELAQSLGFERKAELFTALTEDLFEARFRSANLITRPAVRS